MAPPNRGSETVAAVSSVESLRPALRVPRHIRPVVLITNGRRRGGTEEHMLTVAQGLRRRGVPVAAIVSPRDDLAWLIRGLREAGVEVHLIEETGRRGFSVLGRLAQFVRVLRPYHEGILHLQFNGHPSGELTMLAAKLAGVRTIIRTDHNPPIPHPSLFEHISLRVRDFFFSRIIVLSEQDRTAYIKRFGRNNRKMVVIHNGVDLQKFGPHRRSGSVRARYHFAPDEFVVGNVANLSLGKGTPQLIEMAAQVAQEDPTVRFLVVGNGDHSAEYAQLAASLGLSDRMIFAGRVNPADIPDYLSAMDLFVLPSLVESSPYSALEAMAMEVPVVVTAVGMMPEAISDGNNGRIVIPGDPSALARAVTSVIRQQDRGRAMAKAARRLIEERYSADVMVNNIVDVYDSASPG